MTKIVSIKRQLFIDFFMMKCTMAGRRGQRKVISTMVELKMCLRFKLWYVYFVFFSFFSLLTFIYNKSGYMYITPPTSHVTTLSPYDSDVNDNKMGSRHRSSVSQALVCIFLLLFCSNVYLHLYRLHYMYIQHHQHNLHTSLCHHQAQGTSTTAGPHTHL